MCWHCGVLAMQQHKAPGFLLALLGGRGEGAPGEEIALGHTAQQGFKPSAASVGVGRLRGKGRCLEGLSLRPFLTGCVLVYWQVHLFWLCSGLA